MQFLFVTYNTKKKFIIMAINPIKKIAPLGFPWETNDPFLFCVHHEDFYPAGNENMGPATSLSGRSLGNDFTIKDGFRMYHGKKVPGFPAHPHRGFETVTIARKGFVDHSDSLGAAGRFGEGDVQWMTAGKGVQHCEMFPLLNQEKDNPFEIFQIWLNLPKTKKMAEPYFSMLWNDTIPIYSYSDDNQKTTEVNIIAGEIKGTKAPTPAPDSWAAVPENEVAIWTIKMEAGAKWNLPQASENVNRSIYFYKGSSLKVADQLIENYKAVHLLASTETVIENVGGEEAFVLLLQGKPINEPVAQYGPFVMNSQREIQEAYSEFQQNHFGGWPWPTADHVHDRSIGRFAKYVDGTIVEKKS